VSTFAAIPEAQAKPQTGLAPAWKGVWLPALLTGFFGLWPLLIATLLHGPAVMIRCLTGDSYHYLAIARKAIQSGIYTYDGVHVTNGFHPLWQYTIRGIFHLFHLQSHESQAAAVIWLSLCSMTIGITFASAAIVRITRVWFLGLLVVPGVYYLAVGIQVRNLWIWEALHGMESAYSVLFGGIFFYVLSHFIGASARKPFDIVAACRALGFVLPFLILSRLDDVFILAAFSLALLCFGFSRDSIFRAGLWITSPSFCAIACYLLYNFLTAHAAMPLSGSTKAGFVGQIFVYLAAVIHFPPLMELKAHLTHSAADGATVFSNSFRFVQVLYPLLAAVFGAAALWKHRRTHAWLCMPFAVLLYILIKMTFNLLNVHPWHQADWYYAFAILSLSVLGAVALERPARQLREHAIAYKGVLTIYVLLVMLSGSQLYASLVYPAPNPEDQFWARKDEIRSQLKAHNVTGIINVDDGITAFLLDMPNMHGFAFATDVQAQQAHRQGRMLSLAASRGINTIAGFSYMFTDDPPQTDAAIREYFAHTLAWDTMHGEADHFQFALAYYDPVLKMPFFTFTPR
jgi:hypothetical protein